MGDTVFNIFGSHISDPVITRPIQPFEPNRVKENAFVGKNALSNLTPAKGINISTPNNTDPKKKTFLQNKGASIQTYCPTNSLKKTVLQSNKKLLHVYEDGAAPNKTTPNRDEINQIEYTKKPFADDDGNFSDDEFTLSDDHMNKLIFGIPEHFNSLPYMEMPCISDGDSEEVNIDDILSDDNIFTSLGIGQIKISDEDFPDLF